MPAALYTRLVYIDFICAKLGKMFGLTTTKNYKTLLKETEKLRTEVKGYYDGANEDNALFKAYRRALHGTELAPFLPMSRAEIKAAYETNGCLYGVVHKIARSAGEVSRYLELYDRNTGDVIEKHWVLDLINKPNDRFNTRAKYVEAWAVNRELYSDAWQYAPMTVGADRKCEALYIIPSCDVMPVKGGLMQPLKGVKIAGSQDVAPIEVKDLVISFDYNLDATTFFGTSKAVAAGQYLSIIHKGMSREDTALTNGGAANLITPKSNEYGVMPSDAQELEQRVNGKNAFNKNVTMRVPVDVHTLGSKPNELDILAAHKEAVTVLCFVYELPVDLVYGQAKYENAKEAKKSIYEIAAIPLAEEFGNDLLAHFGLSEQFEFRVNTDRISVLQDKPSDVLDNLAKMHASVNELRESYGYERIEQAYADEPLLPIGVQFGNETADDINELDNED